MTVSSTVYKADSTGNGVTTEFTIPFDLQDESQVLVTKVSAAGVETVLVLNTDYTVSGIGTASRKITLTTALPTGERVIRSPNVSLTQSVDYVEGDDFPAETHEAAVDKLTLICQQLQEQLNRTVKLDISDAVDIDALITNVQTVAENLTNLNIVAGIDTEITAVAGIESAVSTLAAISSEISAVSAVSAGVADVAAIDTDVTAVAAISAAISTLNGIAADISTVAGVSGDVTTVAGVAADVTTVAGLETEILAVPGQAQAAADSAAAAATFDPALYLRKDHQVNKAINGSFAVNQRAVSGTVVLAAGDYGHDCWKAGSSGCTYTFATSNNVTTITITAGSLQQVIIGKNLESGTHCLSWTGTAQGKIGAGSYSASGVTGTATGGTNLTIEFNTGTLTGVSLVKGSIAATFQQLDYDDELFRCQPYACEVPANIRTYATGASHVFEETIDFPRKMVGTPSVTTKTTGSTANTSTVAYFTPSAFGVRFAIISSGAGDCYAFDYTALAVVEL
jgi:hypothetical protein